MSQLPLPIGHVSGQSRDDLIVTPANAEAVTLVESWPRWPTRAVIIAGPTGSGKTHIAAIWRDLANAQSVDAARITAGDIEAAATEPMLVDDADRDGRDETGLFHLFNSVTAAHGSLLMTATRFVPAWDISLPDLLSRVKTAATVEVHEPDDLLLSATITKLFADRQVGVDPTVVQFLVRRCERSLSTAIKLVDRLDAAALSAKSRVTRPLAAAVLQEIEAGR